jgi:hypothetical protein
MNGGSPSTPAMPSPARVFRSTGLMPAACTFTRTSVGSGSGRGTCRTESTSEPPKVCWTTARAGSAKEYGLVDRTVYPAVPLHVEYSLTELGHSAAVPLRMLRSWVEDNVDGAAPSAASCAGDTTASAVNAHTGRP